MKKLKGLKIVCLLGILLSFSTLTLTENVTQVGRYATVDNKPLASQINPLVALQQVHFGTRIHTVGDAVSHWLSFSGYALMDEKEQPESLKAVLHKPLPQVDRDLGPMSVQEGLEVLVGKGIFNLVIDPLNRKIDFKLSPKYAQFYKKQGVQA